MTRTAAIIVAAGRGSRMQSDDNKIFLDLNRKPLLALTLKPFADHPRVDQIVIVHAADEADRIRSEVLCHFDGDEKFVLCAGGDTRQASVHNGLQQISDDAPLVLVHDGARPLVSAELIDRVIDAANEHGAAIPGTAITDSLKRVDASNFVIEAPYREGLYRVQTPQGFHRDLLANALDAAQQSGKTFTDDAGAVQAFTDTKVKIVEGDPHNLKVTTPDDVALARWLLTK